MDESSSPPNSPDRSELKKDVEKMIETVENMSVQLTWMAYDMVALRTSPELQTSMRTLEEVYQKCRAIVCGEQQPDVDV